MPIFEYRCPACHAEFEMLVRGNDHSACPDCGSKKLEKLFSASSAHVGGALPISDACPPSDAPPCRPNCCRLPQ